MVVPVERFCQKVNVRQGTFEYHHATIAFVYAGCIRYSVSEHLMQYLVYRVHRVFVVGYELAGSVFEFFRYWCSVLSLGMLRHCSSSASNDLHHVKKDQLVVSIFCVMHRRLSYIHCLLRRC